MDAYIYLRKKHKLVRDLAVSCPDGLDTGATVVALLSPALEKWDLPRPMVLSRHCRDFEAFGRALFRRDDFVESFAYDALEVEAAARPDVDPEPLW